jgi:hypothetical protein
LKEHEQKEVNLTGRESDYERTYWKFEWKNGVYQPIPYEPELVQV